MAEIPLDVCEQILLGSDVEDLIRWKSVCKSWESLITSRRFVEAQLKHSCKNDRDNNELGHRRITSCSDALTHYPSFCFYNENYNLGYIVVGSCNGLVCVCVYSRDVELVVINPLTREERKLQTPSLRDMSGVIPLAVKLRCWGFGYDVGTHDYKVIIGVQWEVRTVFHVLTLKSNTWRIIGEVNYMPEAYKARSGILCGGALHWLMEDIDETEVLISLDLSKEELKEIPQPRENEEYNVYDEHHKLGVIEGCLCIYSYDVKSFCDSSHEKWVMRNNKWELYNDGGCESKYDVVHHLNINPFIYGKWIMRNNKLLDDDYCEGKYDDDAYSYDEGKRTPNTCGYYLGASIFVKSLVSPHPRVYDENGRPKRNSKVHFDVSS